MTVGLARPAELEAATRIADHLVRGFALGGRVRAMAAVTTATVDRLRQVHDASPTMAAVLGRAATGCLLVAATLEKVTGREPMVTLEVEGDGPAGRVVATASPRGWVRALAQEPTAEVPRRDDGAFDVAAAVGRSGHLTVTRDPGIGQPYRGVVTLRSGGISEDLAQYLVDSEQTPSAVVVGISVGPAGVLQAGGLVVQLLPGVADEEADALKARIRELGSIPDQLDLGRGPDEWLAALFGADFARLDRTPVEFRCGCSTERVETALKLLGEAEIESLAEEATAEPALLTCAFCRTAYPVPRERLEELLAEVRAERASGRSPTGERVH